MKKQIALVLSISLVTSLYSAKPNGSYTTLKKQPSTETLGGAAFQSDMAYHENQSNDTRKTRSALFKFLLRKRTSSK